MKELIQSLGSPSRILLIVAVAIGSHLCVLLVRAVSQRLMASRSAKAYSKAKSILSLVTSTLVSVLYFGAIGLILKEFGISMTAYLASASVIGLAIGFGSQGLVQDVVTGVTLILSDLIDVGDMVEISGQTGLVRSTGLRFTVLENALGAMVFIPNRTIGNVVNYPRGYVRCLVDVTLSSDPKTAGKMQEKVEEIFTSTREQFPGIFTTPPSIKGKIRTTTGKEFLRVKFRLWPGRGATIETTVKQEIVQSLKALNPAYADWMVTVSYEVEKRTEAVPSPISRKGTR